MTTASHASEHSSSTASWQGDPRRSAFCLRRMPTLVCVGDPRRVVEVEERIVVAVQVEPGGRAPVLIVNGQKRAVGAPRLILGVPGTGVIPPLAVWIRRRQESPRGGRDADRRAAVGWLDEWREIVGSGCPRGRVDPQAVSADVAVEGLRGNRYSGGQDRKAS